MWTVSADRAGERIEPGAAPATARFEAGRKCIRMGVPARYKFKPIIPLRGWREDYAAAIEQALREPRPESIGLCVVMWMSLDELAGRIPPDELDPDFVAAAEAARDELADSRMGPFPHDVRKEIYLHLLGEIRRHDAEIPVYISTESREMWDDLAGTLGQRPETYVCGCGPAAVPGRKLALHPDCRTSTYVEP